MSYSQLLFYLNHYCRYTGGGESFKRLIESAGVTLRKSRKKTRWGTHKFSRLSPEDVHKILSLYHQRKGRRHINKRLREEAALNATQK